MPKILLYQYHKGSSRSPQFTEIHDVEYDKF